MTSRQPDWIDIHVGHRIRFIRKERDLSLQELAERLDMSYQQVQKYETGANRVSAGTLFRIAATFDVPVGDFFPEQE